ncbi:MAG: ABC transporter ATP-binding protein [Oscillospiraceae bacterium]|nr:ABC transporter ATP-binding protein [Oscillospiraceae bacterium]
MVNNKKPGGFRRFLGFYKPYKWAMAADVAAAFGITACDLVYPMLTRSIINDVVPNRNLRMLVVFSVSLLGVYLVKLALNYFVTYFGHVIGVKMQADMRRDIFAHMQKLPFKYFDEHQTGALMSRVVNDLQDISELAHHGPEMGFLSVLSMLGAFALLCTINLKLTLIVFAFLPLFIFFMWRMQSRMEHGFAEARRTTAEINAELSNSISGIRVAKAFDNERCEMKKFERTVVDYEAARKLSYRAMAQFHSGMTFFLDAMYLIVLAAAGLFYYNGVINMGDFAAYFLYISQFITPVRRLMQFFEMYEEGKTGFKRFCEIMDVEPEAERPDARDVSDLSGDIVFKDVSFTYGDDRKVLDHLNITIGDGKTVALVGPSGGGKTTLCHLLPRFYDIQGGAITIGGRDIESITRSSLRRGIGIVQQEVFLFTGTIADNIGYTTGDVTREQIVEAAKRASIHDFIMSLDDGYDTYVGERGVRLSGGQKQRIAVARIFLKNPQILILDEATSALDNVTETLLKDALDALCRGRTCLVVAHRLSTIRNADEIIVLTDDGVEEQGTHEQLLARGGAYKALYDAQFA